MDWITAHPPLHFARGLLSKVICRKSLSIIELIPSIHEPMCCVNVVLLAVDLDYAGIATRWPVDNIGHLVFILRPSPQRQQHPPALRLDQTAACVILRVRIVHDLAVQANDGVLTATR